MRFVLAIIAFVVAAGMIATGIAQRTVFAPDPTVALSGSVGDERLAVVSGGALNANDGAQTVSIEADGPVFAAYGREADVEAWVGDLPHGLLEAVMTDGSGSFVSTPVAGSDPLDGIEPAGSDLWLDETSGEGLLEWRIDVPADVSLLVWTPDAAGATIGVTWPQDTSTPLAAPLIGAGGGLLVLGLILYIWGLIHMRRTRGPRRKQPPKPPRMPKPPQPQRMARADRQRPLAPTETAKGRRAARRTALAIGAAFLLLPLAGPAHATEQSPSPTQEPTTPAVVTSGQLVGIVNRVAATAVAADAALDADLAATRFTGAALLERQAAYRIKAADANAPLPEALPAASDLTVEVGLPQATDTWPRVVFAVVSTAADTAVPPLALTLIQEAPRENYLVSSSVPLTAGTALPALASAGTGTARLGPDVPLLAYTPTEVADGFAAVLGDPNAASRAVFGETVATIADRLAEQKSSVQGGLETAQIAFAQAVDPTSIVALATSDAGAIVTATVTDTWSTTPTQADAEITPSGGARLLSGIETTTTTGFSQTFAYTVLFAVPPAGSAEPVRLLGFAQGLVAAAQL